MPISPTQVRELVEKLVAERGFDLEDITVRSRDGQEELSIVVDRDGGSDLDVLADLAGDGAIDLAVTVKEPGSGTDLSVAHMTEQLDEVADGLPPYARLIVDVLRGDRSLFTRPDGLAHVWEVAAPVLANPPAPQPYAAGSTGPAAADDLCGGSGWI